MSLSKESLTPCYQDKIIELMKEYPSLIHTVFTPILSKKKILEIPVSVFNNLIKNSTQAILQDYEGKITIDLKMESSAVLVTITDNGVGIEKSKLGKIFVPYFTTKSNGTGLGLAMVKQIKMYSIAFQAKA